ncbi:hypothetical protein BH11PLA2_BH11PLA2_22070 [soil metagenome]
MLKRIADPSSLFFVASLLVLLVVFRERGLTDPGTFWHTRVGDIILADGFITTDPFTFTFEGQTWIPQLWAGEIFMATLHRLGGFDSLLFGFLVLYTAGFTLVFRRLLHGGMGWPLAAAVAAFAMVAAGFHFFVRPHVFTIVFMIVLMGLLCDVHAKRCPWRKLLWLVPLHIVWTNIHGGMLGGLATFALTILVWFVDVKRHEVDGPLVNWKDWFQVVGILLACSLTMFINPFGLEMMRFWFRLIGSATIMEKISEHTPLDLRRGGDQAVVAFMVLYCVMVAGAFRQVSRQPFWLIPVFWFVASCQSIRHGPLFVATAGVMIADIWPKTVYYRKLLTGGDTLAMPERWGQPFPLAAWFLPGAIVTMGLILQAKQVTVPLLGSGWARFDPKYVPMDLVDAVRDIPPGTRIYNDANLGGFLIGNAPYLRIFMDDRCELCGDVWLQNYVAVISNHPERFDDWQRTYGFQWAMIKHEATPDLDAYIRDSGRWVVVAKGNIATLYRLK